MDIQRWHIRFRRSNSARILWWSFSLSSSFLIQRRQRLTNCRTIFSDTTRYFLYTDPSLFIVLCPFFLFFFLSLFFSSCWIWMLARILFSYSHHAPCGDAIFLFEGGCEGYIAAGGSRRSGQQ